MEKDTLRTDLPESLLERFVFFTSGLALGTLMGGAAKDFTHSQNLIATALVTSAFFVSDTQIPLREAAHKSAYMASGLVTGMYVRQFINQLYQA